MKKLQKILMMTVLVSMLLGIAAVASSAAATMAPSRTLWEADGEKLPSVSNGSQMCTAAAQAKGGNKYYEIDFIDKGANANFGSGNVDFLGKGDYIVMEFDFMAEDWTTVKSILIGWNSRNSSGGALNDMHFSFSNSKGAPTITGNPLSGSVTLDPTPGVWHHFAMIVQIGGEHTEKKAGVLTAVQGQDAVEAYAYVDGELFAKNLIGDGKEFWSKDTTYFQSLRLTANSYGGQRLCMDNVRIVQYEGNRELREFFKYREKNGGEFPNLNAVDYPFFAYDADYDYPLGTPNCKVVELNGNETQFDRFEKASKFAAATSGSKLVLLSNIKDAVVKYPVQVDRAGYQLDFTMSPNLRMEEQTIVNPITGALSNEISFIQKTKYAYYRWQIDHTGEVFDSRGYTPLAIGADVAYNGSELQKSYYRDGVLYTFTGEWLLNDSPLLNVPAYAANSYYTLTPVIKAENVYAIIETVDGVSYALSVDEVVATAASASKDSVITLVKDVVLTAPLAINQRVTLDLAGKTLTVNEAASAISLANSAAGTVITSSAAGAKINAAGAAFDAACAFVVDGENLTCSALSLLTSDATAYGVVIDGGLFLLKGNAVLLLGDAASVKAEINATILADGATILADPSKSYAVTLSGVLSGVTIPASATSSVTLAEGLLLSGVSSFVEVALPAGVSVADASLVIAAKKVNGENGAATDYVVVDADEAVLLAWEADAHEYVIPGEKVAYSYSDYYDARRFYTSSGVYSFAFEGDAVVGNVAEATWAGKTVVVSPVYDASAFYVVVVKPDGTCVPFTSAANLSALLSSGTYEAGTLFAIGQKNMILEGMTLTKDYVLDLNGYALTVSGTNKIAGGSLKIFSTVDGACFYSDATQAFFVTNGALKVENVAYLGGALAYLDASSTLEVNGGIYVVNADASFVKADQGAIVSVAGIAANKELFAAESGYAWVSVSENVTIGGLNCEITVKYEKNEE